MPWPFKATPIAPGDTKLSLHVISKEAQRLRNLYTTAQDFSPLRDSK